MCAQRLARYRAHREANNDFPRSGQQEFAKRDTAAKRHGPQRGLSFERLMTEEGGTEDASSKFASVGLLPAALSLNFLVVFRIYPHVSFSKKPVHLRLQPPSAPGSIPLNQKQARFDRTAQARGWSQAPILRIATFTRSIAKIRSRCAE